MTLNGYYKLCGGTFFALISYSRKPLLNKGQNYAGQSSGRSEPDTLLALARMVTQDIPTPFSTEKKTLRDNTRDFKACINWGGRFFRFNESAVKKSLDDRVQQEYQKVLIDMTRFTEEYLDIKKSTKKDEYLVKALVEVLAADEDIKGNQAFYICEDGSTMTKAEIVSTPMICLQSFLLGIWHYVITGIADNRVGAETYNKWCPPRDGAERLYTAAIGENSKRKIRISYHILPNQEESENALAKQFYKIAQGNGNADDIVKDCYNPEAHIISFPEYAERTKAKYEKTETPFSDGEERLLEDIYVCNILSSRLAATKNRHSRTQEKIIPNATLDLIKEYSKKVILVANGGMGKSIMLQQLFLESIHKHLHTGLLPIMIELRDFSESNNLFSDYIVKTAGTFDGNLTGKKVEELMSSGKCQILMDGADEIDPSDSKAFQRQIAELVDRYPYNQYVVASRECDIIKAVMGFSKLYLRPFNREQSSALINNLLVESEDEAIRDEIINYIEGDFLKKHKVFASNPMLLTFVIMKYPIVDSFHGKKRLFYRTVYDAIVCGHDEKKKGYSRVFRSAQNAEEFTKVFRELCAATYIKHEVEFDRDTFDEYFKNLVSKDNLVNPKIMTSKNFIHDACATACMMYEEDIKLFYIDPGFQEYLFAQHYFSAAPEELETLGHTLWDVAETEFDGNDAFEMLNEFSTEKFERYFLKPYLHNIFNGKSENAEFIFFLRYGYREFEYQVVNTDMVATYASKNSAEWIPPKPIVVEPSSIILSILLRRLEISNLLCFAVFENALNYPEFMTAGIFGEHYFDSLDSKKKIIPRRLLQQDTDDLQAYERTHAVENYVRDDDQHLVCFGYEYKVDFDRVLKTPETYSASINILKTPEEDVWKAYCKVKGYYEELIKKGS